MNQICLRYASSTVLEVCFYRARGVFRPCSGDAANVCSRCIPTVLEVSFYSARGVFPPCSSNFSTVFEYALTLLEVGFDLAQVIFRVMLHSCSRYALVVLEVGFDRA